MSSVIVDHPYYPTLLLSPGVSRDRDGAVSPDVGDDIDVVPGTYGGAWQPSVRSSRSRVSHPLDGIVTPQEGTVVIRAFDFDPNLASNQYLLRLGNVSSAPTIYLQGVSGTLRLTVRSGDSLQIENIAPLPTAMPFAVSVQWTGNTATARLMYDGVDIASSMELDPFVSTEFSEISTGYSSLNSTAAYEGILVYDTALSDTEIQRISTMPGAWTWNAVGQQVLRPQEISISTADPAVLPLTGIRHYEDEVFITDRNNEVRIPLEGVDVHPTWDIDRSGSKGQIAVTAHRGGLEENMWIATYRTIVPERGEIIRYPRGHWRLSGVSTSYDGSHEMDTGIPSQPQTARGTDIIDDLAEASLTQTFATPRTGIPMSEVRNLIQLATMGTMGGNLVPNGSFEDEGDGWLIGFTGGAVGSHAWTATGGNDTPDGVKVWRTNFTAGTAENGYTWAFSPYIPVPTTPYMYFSGQFWSSWFMSNVLELRFYDSSDNQIDVHRARPSSEQQPDGRWHRDLVVVPIPDNAATFRVVALTFDRQGGRSSAVFWDDIRAGSALQMPLPDSRINLPPSSATASTRIQTAENKSIGYDAINADRLSATGHYALHTDMDGRLTTVPIRNLGTTSPKYTFGPDDIEILSDPVDVAGPSRPHYNHFSAVKEAFEEDEESMSAHSYNNNVNDPHSVINVGRVVSAPATTVQDAVDEDALQAVADGARDRYSTQEEIRFSIMPLPDLTVYDVIRIVDADMPKANGDWAMNSIDDTPGGYMAITARRATTGGS